MQVHADALALLLQCFGEFQRTQPQALLAGPGLCLHDRRPLRLLGRPQREEIGRKQVCDDAGPLDVLHRIGTRFLRGT